MLPARPFSKAASNPPIQESLARRHLSPAELQLYWQGCFMPAYPLLRAHTQALNDAAKTPLWILDLYTKHANLRLEETHNHVDPTCKYSSFKESTCCVHRDRSLVRLLQLYEGFWNAL
jgi:hypothetical protein